MMYDYVAQRRLLLMQNGFAMSRTFGRSMRPLIWGGQHIVVVAPVDGEPAVGDLIMFRQNSDGREVSIAHRLIETEEDDTGRIYITRGDNCQGCERVRRDEIIGRVVEVHRVTGFRPWHIIPAKTFKVTDRAYRCYYRLWAAIWPARRLYYILRDRATGLLNRIRSNF